MWHRLSHRISSLEAHHRFGIAAGIAVIAFLALQGEHRLPLRLIGTWDAFAMAFLLLAWVRLLNAEPHTLARLARLQHSVRRLIFLFVIGGAMASLSSIGFILGSAREAAAAQRTGYVIATLGTVAISWFLVHTVFALHYAYLFYRPAAKSTKAKGSCGLDFPDTEQPDYADFAYFSFVIGMTSQVSDVQITGKQIRRWALVHGLVSFLFNAAILALSINIVSSLF